MSSPPPNIPPQLQLSIPAPTSFKRSFEQYFDLDSPASTASQSIDRSSTASSSSGTTRSQNTDENRRKRARSAGSLSDPESSEASSSTLSSFDSASTSTDSLSHSASSQNAARRHLLLDLGLGRGLGSSVALGLGMAAAELQLGISEPPPRIPTPELLDAEDVDMPDIDLDFSRPEEHEEEPSSPAEHVRRSVDRFNTFERHISVLRSSSPPVIPLPPSLTSHQVSLSPPTLPPLPLVELGLDGEDEDEQEHIPSTATTNTASTPPRLDLNLPPTTSLSPGPSSPRLATDQTATQFRERLDSAIDGLGGGDLYFEAPISLPTAQRPDDDLDRHFQRVRQSLATSSTASNASGSSTASGSASRARPSVENPLFEWAPTTLDWNITLNPSRASGSSAEAPSLSPWRAHFRTPSAAMASDTAPGSPPYQPPRMYPRPASLAAPLSVPATTSSLDGLDVDLVDAYLDSVRANSNTNTRAWESAVDRARASRRQREREREEERAREREQTMERLRERERAREREREDEAEREREHPWSLDSIWETSGGAEALSSARPRPWESLTLRTRREMEDESEVALELARRRALQRQMHQTLDRERDRQRDEQHERGQSSSISRAARYLESGLVDPRETPASSSTVPPRERRLRPPSDTSNPFTVSWSSRRSTRPISDEPSRPPRLHRSRSSSQTREGVSTIDWLGQMEERDHDESRTHLDLFDEWSNSEHPTPRSITPGFGASSSSAPREEREGLGFSRRNVNPRGPGAASGSTLYDDRDGLDFLRRAPGESSTVNNLWRGGAGWEPRLALSPQSTAQPTRTPTHARAQSIPSSSLSSLTSIAPQPSLHRLRSRMHGAPRSAGIGSANSLVAENAAAIRRREARTELMERLNRTVSMDIDALYDFASDYDPPRTQRGRAHRPFGDEDEDMDLDGPDFASGRPRTPPRRPLRLPRPRNASPEVPDFSGARTPPRRPLRLQRLRDASPDDSRIPTGDAVRPRSSLDLDQEPEEPPTASSSSVNPVAGANTWRPRRPVARFRQHNIHSEISPPPSATASVDRRHASWEAPSRDAGVSNTYQYLSAISDLAQTITSPSNDEPLRTPPSPIWPENESPFSTLFARSGAGPSSTRPTPASLTRPTPGASSSSRDPETNRDFSSNAAESRVPSLPPPDLGGDFERSGDMLRSTISNGAGANVTMFPSARSITPPTPPPHNPYTGPFRLTMQRREEQARRAARRVPDPPSIPPLSFGRDFDHPTAPPSQEQSHLRQLAARLDAHRSELSPSARFEEAERRLFNYRGPSTSRAQDGDPRRFFPSRPTATSSTSQAEEPPQPRRYSATDMHNVLARQARLEGSRLAPDLPSRLDPDLPSTWRLPRGNTAGASTDISHDPSSSASRADRLISRYHQQRAEADARESSSFASAPWATLSSHRVDRSAVEPLEARRRRLATGARNDNEPPTQFRHRAYRDPTFHAMFGLGATARFRRRALGDYVRDEDFDGSYENLLTLGGMIGDAKPKATPEHVLAGLESASYKDWATAESDPRCPICLDDYQPSDPVMKLGDCRHWLHKECLEQWLKGASTCPVCRKDVKGKARRHHHHHSGPEGSRRRDGDGPDGPGPSGGGGGSGNGNGNTAEYNALNHWLSFLRD